MNGKNTTMLSTSEMQLRLALALVILGFEERVDKETRELLEIEQAMHELQRQREALLEQRKKDTDYLRDSMRHLYPDVSLTLSEEGRVEIPSGVLQQLQQAQQQHLPAPPALLAREQVADSDSPGEQTDTPTLPQETVPPHSSKTFLPSPVSDPTTLPPETVPPATIAGETHKETDIDPWAKEVLAYVFSQPQASVLDWKITVQRALNLPEPPKMKGHKAYKAMLQAYPILESLHDGTLLHPSDALTHFYTQYFIEGERWGDYKDVMNEWGIA